MKTRRLYLFCIIILHFLFPTLFSAQVFVDISAGGNNDGSSWANAYTSLSVALNNTTSGEIWVANGSYKPVVCNPCIDSDREMSFNIPPLVQLYGGFAGNENQLSERDWLTNLTILSGDIGVINDSTDNSYKILVAENSLEITILDGFIIEEGNADGSFGFSSGGGLYIDANPGGTGNIQIRNCTFRNNFAGGGGAMAIDCVLGGVCEALIHNCVFEGNTASTGNVTSTGAGIFIQGNSGAQIKPRIIGCTFQDNFVGNDGGGISMTPSGAGTLLAPLIDSCLFINNGSTDRGSAIWYRMTSFGEMAVVISNSQFISNQSGGQGGAIFARSSFDTQANDTLINCLFSQNISDGSSTVNDGEGGAIFLRGSQDGTRNHQIINCVFDRNFAADRGGAVGTTSISSTGGTCNSNFVNCTFYGNKTNGEGGAVHAEGTDGVNNMTFTNSIFWRDSTATGGNEFFNNGAAVTVAYSDIDGGIPTGVIDGGNNLDTIPQFADQENGDLHLTGCSPLINIGDNSAIPPSVIFDLDGDSRIHEGIVDYGAYEIGVIYVDQSATGGANNGKSWIDAFLDFQDAISASSSGDQIWIAEGTYFPTDCLPCSNDDREIAFHLKPDVEVYGGFAGNETQLSQRDWATNLTILSGDIGVAVDSTDNSYKILIAENSTTKTIFDGFIIEEGNADGSFGFSSGGGLYIDANPGGTGNIQIRNCTFRNNFAGGGGAMAIDCVLGGVCEALIYNCVFEGNTASTGNVTSTGAGIFIQGNSGAQIKPRIIGCTFQDNFVGNDGGGISMTPSGAGTLLAPLIDSCLFINNGSTDRGSAIWYRMTSFGEMAVVISNSQFISNHSGGQGGAIFARSSFDTQANDTLANCLFSQNISDGSSTVNDGEGGAIFLRGSQDGTRNHQIINCVFDRNFAADRGGAVGTTSISSTGGTCNSNFVNCTFYGNKTNGEGGAVHAEGTDGVNNMTFTNSIFWRDSTAIAGNEFFNNGATVTVSYSDIDGGIPSGIIDGGNNFEADPQFLDPDNGDLHISSCSPVKDVGLNSAIPLDLIDLDGDGDISEQIDIDLDGLPRIFDTVVDLGAYEWNGTPELMTISLDSTNVTCNGFCDGTISVTPAGGVPDYNFSWSNGENTSMISGLCPGTYSVTVSDAFSCVLTDSVTISENEELVLNVSPDTILCSGESVTLTSTGSGGTGNYTYNWDNGLGAGASHTVFPTTTTTYSVTVNDENNCTTSESIIVTINEALPQITGQLSICTGSSTILDAGIYDTYNWSTGDTTQMIAASSAGLYSVTVTDASGCTGEDEVEVIENENLTPEITGQLSICTGSSTILDAGIYDTYNWSTGDTTQMITVSVGGLYSVTVTDTNGCTGEDEVEVVENENLSPTITGQLSICTGSSSILDAGLYDTYSWSTGDTTQMIAASVGGLYSVTVTDASGCTGEDEVEVIENENLTPEITGQLSICTGSSSILDAGLYDTYSWSTGDTTQMIAASVGGLYSVTVTDASGCTGEDEVEVIENENLSPTITGQLSICTGSSSILDAGLYDTYSWSTGDTTQMIAASVGGLYSVTVTDASGCTGEDEVEVIENENLSPAITGQLSICTGSSSILDAGLYDTYSWSTGDTTQMIAAGSAGLYSVTVTDASGCNGEDEVEVVENENLTPAITGQLSICTGSSTILDAGIYDTYSWSTGDTMQMIAAGSAGLYSVTVTDASGCTGEDEVEVIENENLSPTITGQLSICTGSSTIIDAGIYDTYNWSTGDTTQMIAASSGGLYSVTVTDANGCTGEDEVEVVLDSGITTEEEVELCYGGEFDGTIYFQNTDVFNEETGTNGCDSTHIIHLEVFSEIMLELYVEDDCFFEGATVIALATGGNNDYNYQWSNGQSGSVLSEVLEGTISVTVTDGLGCTQTGSIFVDPVPTLSYEYNVDHVSCFGESDGEINITITGGLPPFQIEWFDGSMSEDLVNLGSGNYTVFVSDGNGCVRASTITVFEPAPLIVDVQTTPSTTGDNGTASAIISGGTTPYTYQWSNGSTDVVIENLSPGNYTLTVSDSNGCITETVFQISNTTSASGQESFQSFELYPNPGTGQFYIEIESSIIKEIQLKIFDSLGRQILDLGKFSGKEFVIPLVMHPFSTGNYFLIIDTGGERLVKPFLFMN